MVKRYEHASITWLSESDKYESNVVYLLTFNDDEREMYYVGRTTGQLRDRIHGHHNQIIPNPKSLIQQAVSKLKHFTISILCKCDNKDELKVKEEYYTLQYRSNEREFGYNLQVGDKLSEKQKSEKSEMIIEYYKTHSGSMSGKHHSEKTRKNHSKFMKEYNKTHGNPRKGKTNTEEQCRKNGEAHSIKCKSIPDNIIFDSIKQCQDYYSKLYGHFDIYGYLRANKTHIKSGQTFVRLKD